MISNLRIVRYILAKFPSITKSPNHVHIESTKFALNFRSKSLDLPRNLIKIILPRRPNSFSLFNEYSKVKCVFKDPLPEYDSAMKLSVSTKVLPPCYFKVMLDKKPFRNGLILNEQAMVDENQSNKDENSTENVTTQNEHVH